MSIISGVCGATSFTDPMCNHKCSANAANVADIAPQCTIETGKNYSFPGSQGWRVTFQDYDDNNTTQACCSERQTLADCSRERAIDLNIPYDSWEGCEKGVCSFAAGFQTSGATVYQTDTSIIPQDCVRKGYFISTVAYPRGDMSFQYDVYGAMCNDATCGCDNPQYCMTHTCAA
jgi:hypothetical protein